MKEIIQSQQDLLKNTSELVSKCKYCTQISTDPDSRTPISCTKYAGSAQPIRVNLYTCLTCGEFKNL